MNLPLDATGPAGTGGDPSEWIDSQALDLLRCPVTGERLKRVGAELVSTSGARRYRVDEYGIPLFAEEFCSPEAKLQQEHYDRIAAAYLENLAYPHTQEYNRYLDRIFLDAIPGDPLGVVAEICCGRGEAFHLLRGRRLRGIGLDVSVSMLRAARRDLPQEGLGFLQGDATSLPLADASFDLVVMLGGIHHVNNRAALFSEVFRVLKPGGRFCFREPLNDFFLWRMLRAVVYRLSPTLDHVTEHPLRRSWTTALLLRTGFELRSWRGCGFLGFCLLMNSDVLVVNRLFRYIPGIRAFTRLMAKLDELVLRVPGMGSAGLLVVGMAEKPHSRDSLTPAPR